MNIYFAGSIYGGRQKLDAYKILIKELSNYGTVLNKQVADDDVIKNEIESTDEEIFDNLINLLKVSDLVFADVTIPSFGVGYELGIADSINKRIIAIYDSSYTFKVSTMIRGNKNIKLIEYKDINEIINNLEIILKGVYL